MREMVQMCRLQIVCVCVRNRVLIEPNCRKIQKLRPRLTNDSIKMTLKTNTRSMVMLDWIESNEHAPERRISYYLILARSI